MSLENCYLNDPGWEPSITTWYRIWCPFCETPNWFSGDEKYDIDGVDCWECKCLFWAIPLWHRNDCYGHYLEPDIDDDMPEFSCYPDILEKLANVAKGQKEPKV